MELDPASLLAAARAREGAVHQVDTAEVRFLPALERLTGAIEDEARLTTAGRSSSRSALVAALQTQLQATRLLDERPEIAALPIERPLFIVGMPRTGSTLLHNLLAQHPSLRAPRLWELMHPASPAQTAAQRERLVRATAVYIRDYYRAAPAFRSIHHLDPELPEECHRISSTTFANDIFAWRYRIPRYAAWLDGQDRSDAYAWHATLLRCILARCPGERLVLKCPTHAWQLRALVATYPDARLVRLHREPVATITSACSLTAAIRSARSQVIGHAEIGRYWLRRAVTALDPGLVPAKDGGVRTLDVRYPDLVRDPIGTVAAICDWAGLPLTAVADRRMRRFLADDPSRQHGAHRYAPEDFGLRRAEVDGLFEEYRKEFRL